MSVLLATSPKHEVRNLPNFPGYAIGWDGSVWSYWEKRGRKKSVISLTRKRLKPSITRGYYQVALTRNGVVYYRKVHRLVLEEFIGPRPQGTEACHENGNKLDNRVTNLRWGTKSENYQDRFRHGTDNNGERNGRSVLNSLSVLAIRMRLTLGESQENLANEFGVSQVMISRIKLRKAWKHV